MQSIHLSAYRFDRPLLITETDLKLPSSQECSDGLPWIRCLGAVRELRGVILPLESSGQVRQRLPGLMWLKWLRWSADERARFVPVLACAWQDFEEILRRCLDLLLVADGSTFLRLPDGSPRSSSRIDDFINGTRQDALQSCSGKELERIAFASTNKALQVRHHDLANDNYAAYRLWCGYRHVLRKAADGSNATTARAAKAILRDLETRDPSFLSVVESKRLQPEFRQVEASRSLQRLPAYPLIESADAIVERHVTRGIDAHARILFVDDEFEKGTAEALLHVLFGGGQRALGGGQGCDFLRSGKEWVYAEAAKGDADHRKARMVCVANTQLARNWLAKWGVLPVEDQRQYDAWLFDWNCRLQACGWMATRQHESLSSSARKKLIYGLDDDELPPIKMKTIVLLDLRLDQADVTANYRIDEFSSVGLRNDIKGSEVDVPVIVFTASRQAINLSQVMAAADALDGWLIKEAPDVVEDDANSAQAALYLLSRIHLLCARGDWYRCALNWDEGWIDEGNKFFESEERQSCEGYVGSVATDLFNQMRSALDHGQVPFSDYWKRNAGAGYIRFIRENTSPPAFTTFVGKMIARRFAVAALLLTADTFGMQIDWDPERFKSAVLGGVDPQNPDDCKRVYNSRLNWGRDLQIRTKRLPILAQLLKSEYEWLLDLRWPEGSIEVVRQELTRQMDSAYGATLSRTDRLGR